MKSNKSFSRKNFFITGDKNNKHEASGGSSVFDFSSLYTTPFQKHDDKTNQSI